LPIELKEFQIKITPEKIHYIMAFASLFIGEGATMASECAVLGTPAIYVNSNIVGYIEEQVKYGLVYSFRNSKNVLDKAIEILEMENLKEEFQKRRQKLLSEKIDITAFLSWFVENYPESREIMKKDTDYQYRFR
jgi:predicted glycosyltransferase